MRSEPAEILELLKLGIQVKVSEMNKIILEREYWNGVDDAYKYEESYEVDNKKAEKYLYVKQIDRDSHLVGFRIFRNEEDAHEEMRHIRVLFKDITTHNLKETISALYEEFGLIYRVVGLNEFFADLKETAKQDMIDLAINKKLIRFLSRKDI